VRRGSETVIGRQYRKWTGSPTSSLCRQVALVAAIAYPAAQAHAEHFEATLDMDRDGTMDRAVLETDPDTGHGDLSIYLGTGAAEPDPARQPTILKRQLEGGGAVFLEGNDKGSLLLTYGCGGCSNDFETTLTIVYRGGEFLVGGYTYTWDTRYGAGTCDVNYLTGKGVMIDGVDGKPVALDETFRPVRLADWTDESFPKACDLS
jgi:hypothetical protein